MPSCEGARRADKYKQVLDELVVAEDAAVGVVEVLVVAEDAAVGAVEVLVVAEGVAEDVADDQGAPMGIGNAMLTTVRTPDPRDAPGSVQTTPRPTVRGHGSNRTHCAQSGDDVDRRVEGEQQRQKE